MDVPSCANICLKILFKKLEYNGNHDATSRGLQVKAFHSKGYIELQEIVGHFMASILEYLIVSSPSSYNIILRPPTVNKMKAAVST